MKVLIKSAWGSADPTQAAFPFHHANAFAEAGHEVQVFLLGEAVSLMRMGPAFGCAGEGNRPSSPDSRLRCLLTSPWGSHGVDGDA